MKYYYLVFYTSDVKSLIKLLSIIDEFNIKYSLEDSDLSYSIPLYEIVTRDVEKIYSELFKLNNYSIHINNESTELINTYYFIKNYYDRYFVYDNINNKFFISLSLTNMDLDLFSEDNKNMKIYYFNKIKDDYCKYFICVDNLTIDIIPYLININNVTNESIDRINRLANLVSFGCFRSNSVFEKELINYINEFNKLYE